MPHITYDLYQVKKMNKNIKYMLKYNQLIVKTPSFLLPRDTYGSYVNFFFDFKSQVEKVENEIKFYNTKIENYDVLSISYIIIYLGRIIDM